MFCAQQCVTSRCRQVHKEKKCVLCTFLICWWKDQAFIINSLWYHISICIDYCSYLCNYWIYLFDYVSHPCFNCLSLLSRDLVSSQRSASATTTPSRNFFSTFLPQGKRAPVKTPQGMTGSSPSQASLGRKDPLANQVRAGDVLEVSRGTLIDFRCIFQRLSYCCVVVVKVGYIPFLNLKYVMYFPGNYEF